MDIVSQSTLDGLRLCGDTTLIPDRSFDLLVEHACQTILSTARDQSLTCNKPVAGCQNQDAVKQNHASIIILMLEAAKADLHKEQLSLLLDDCQLPTKRKDTIIASFVHYKSDLRNHLSRVGVQAPNLIDLDWRLDYQLKNSHVHKINEVQYTISLKQDSGETIDFVCSRDELQDLVGKLKEASKAIERASQT